MFEFCSKKIFRDIILIESNSFYYLIHPAYLTGWSKFHFSKWRFFWFSDEDMLSVASMMSLNEMDNFEFDDERKSSMKKINRLSGSANLNDTGK